MIKQRARLSSLLFPQAVEKLVQGAESGCPTEREKQVILNCTRILTRILPYIFEDQDWRGFFWSTVPGAGRAGVSGRRKKGKKKTTCKKRQDVLFVTENMIDHLENTFFH